MYQPSEEEFYFYYRNVLLAMPCLVSCGAYIAINLHYEIIRKWHFAVRISSNKIKDSVYFAMTESAGLRAYRVSCDYQHCSSFLTYTLVSPAFTH